MPIVQVYSATVTLAGDNTLVAAPGAGLRIVPLFVLLQNATATADVYLLFNGPSAIGTKLLTVQAQNQGDGVLLDLESHNERRRHQVKCAANAPLVLNKAEAVGANVTVWYVVESALEE